MENVLTWITYLAIPILLGVVVFLSAQVAIDLAKKNRTIGTPRSGHIMIVVVAEMVTKYIMIGSEGKRIDRKTGKVEDGEETHGLADTFFLARWFLELTGWFWLGLFGKALWVNLQHKEFLSDTTEVGGQKRLDVNRVHECVKRVDQIPLRQTFALAIPAVEVKESRFDIDIFVLVTLEITHAGKAYVFIQDATLNALSTIQADTRGWGARQIYRALLETQSEAGKVQAKDSLLGSLLSLNEGPEGLDTRYGLKIIDVDIRQIRLPEDIREALQLEGKAEERRKEKLIDANAAGEEARLIGEGEAKALAAKVRALNGDHTSLERLATAEAIRFTSAKMLSINGPGLVPTVDASNFNDDRGSGAPPEDRPRHKHRGRNRR